MLGVGRLLISPPTGPRQPHSATREAPERRSLGSTLVDLAVGALCGTSPIYRRIALS